MEMMGRLTRNGTVETVSRNQNLTRELRAGKSNTHFLCSAHHDVQDWQPSYPVNPYSCYKCDHTYIHKNNTHTHTPREDQCEWHRMTRMTGPDCVVI